MNISVSSRGPVIHPGIARMLLKRVEQGQSWNDAWIPLNTRANIEASLRTDNYRYVCEEIYNGLSEMGKQVADLQAIIFEAEQELCAYLTDNTEEVFEELPELDGILSILREADA